MKDIKKEILIKKAKEEKSIRKHTDDLKESLNKLKQYRYIIDEKLFSLIDISCEYHDYGKVNSLFAKRIESGGKIKFDKEKEVAHNVLSLCFVEKEDFKDLTDYHRVSYAILNHHHNGENFKEALEKKEQIKEFANEYGKKHILKSRLNKMGELKEDIKAQLIKGFLHKCDYSASGDYQVEYQNDFLNKALDDLNYKWNPMQEFAKENQNSHIIVIANTGMGKTEAGLRWIGNNKGFFILPLQTAINAMYNRIKKDLIKEKVTERLALLHSNTYSVYTTEQHVEDKDILSYYNKGKNLTLPLTITTLDQIFDFVFRYNGFELKQATYSYSKLVIDEIQAYSPDLLAYIYLGLEMIHKVGGRVAIMTATLPPFIRDEIEKALGGSKNVKSKKFVEGIDRHRIKVIEEKINVKDIESLYLNKRGKVLVVCNTVRKAQEIYDELKEVGLESELNMLHAKYISKDRKLKEDFIIKFGDNKSKGNGIWIATSLVEASLDIDFDYLFTELNDLNGLFQRLGRVNRKGLKYKMLSETNAFIYSEIEKRLLKKSATSDKGFIDATIYELSKKALLQFSNNNNSSILSEIKKSELIEEWFKIENVKNSPFYERYKLMKNYIASYYIGEVSKKEVIKKFRNIVSFRVIPQNIYKENKLKIDNLVKIIKKSNPHNKDEKEKLKSEKIKAQIEFEEYIVSVGYYDTFNEVDKIILPYDNIKVIDCNYSFERGFERIDKENVVIEDGTDFFF